MFNSKLLLLIVVIGFSIHLPLNGQSNIQITTIQEESFSYSVGYKPEKGIQYQFNNKLDINVKPVDPFVLQDLLTLELMKSGELHDQGRSVDNRSVLLKKKRSRAETKSDLEMLVELTDSLLAGGVLNQKEYETVLQELDEQAVEKNGEPLMKTRLMDNPVFVGGRYLNLFEIEFINKSDGPIDFNGSLYLTYDSQLDEFVSKNTLLDYLAREKRLSIFLEDFLTTYYLDAKTFVPPGQTVKKYIAVSPFFYNSLAAKVHIRYNDQYFGLPIDINVDRSLSKVKTDYYVFKTDVTIGASTSVQSSASSTGVNLIIEGRDYCVIVDNELYVPTEHVNKKIKAISIYCYSDYVYYKIIEFTPIELLNFKKNTREEIDFVLNKFSAISRKR